MTCKLPSRSTNKCVVKYRNNVTSDMGLLCQRGGLNSVLYICDEKWVKVFYTDISSCVINNGHISNCFNLTRGVRQGCPLSCYIFIMCAELMSIAIRCNENIRGISIGDSEIKITQFADDTTLIMDGSESSISNAINVIDNFSAISGLKLNVCKSNFRKIGSIQNSDHNFFTEKNYIWTKGPVKFLGVNVSLDKNEM